MEWKPKRPCAYCGKEQSHLVRHLKRSHRNEQAVKDALKLPKNEQDLVFNRIKKEGIFLRNIRLQQKGSPLLRERRQGASDLAMCDICHGFYTSTTLDKHRQRCALVTGSFGGPEDKSKPKRPCVYCGETMTHLRRHLTRRHSDEAAVKAALELPKAEQDAMFERLRKEGMCQANVAREKLGLPLLRERRDGSHHGLTKCVGCQGFYDSHTLLKHQRRCSFLTQPLEFSSTTSETAEKADLMDPSKQFQIVLGRLRGDAIGQLCKSDPIIKLFGKTLCEENVAVGKVFLMKKLRLLAKIILKMRLISSDESIFCKNLLDKDRIERLLDVIALLSSQESSNLRNTLTYRVHLLLKNLIRIVKRHYTELGEESDLEKVEEFAAELRKNWRNTFTFKNAMEQRRQKSRECYRAKRETSKSNKADSVGEAGVILPADASSTSTAEDKQPLSPEDDLLLA